MSCCCTNTLDFCPQDVCGDVDFETVATIAGVYRMDLFFLSIKISINEIFAVGQEIIFPITKLNESFEFIAEIYDPNGTRVLIRKDNIDYDCFKFKTIINVAV